MSPRRLVVRRLGLVPYEEALSLQRTLVDERRAGAVPDTLLLLQHPHVLTLGVRKGGGRANILAAPERLEALGVSVFEAGRGGDVTYHGPGQLVGYPIIDLRPDRQDVHRYVRDIEEVMIRACGEFGVTAERLKGLTGAWVRREGSFEKIAAIGVRISRWITSHGFALNVNTALDFFNLIVPCGISEHGVTSLQAMRGSPLTLTAVEDAVVRHFADVFGAEVAKDSALEGGIETHAVTDAERRA